MPMKILYEDQELIVAVKPAGVESQAARRFAPDMVSEIKKHLVINKLCTPGREPYVGVIHRLDKPVSGIMVYGKTPKAAASLSAQVQSREIQKVYHAVVCGKPVDNRGNYVDYLLKSPDGNYSQVVDKGTEGAKRAELSWETIKSIETKTENADGDCPETALLTLIKIHLKTGRHHQIRVQMAAHGTPVYGDNKYGDNQYGNNQHGNNQYGKQQYGNNQCKNQQTSREGQRSGREILALCATSLTFVHPKTKKVMEFSIEPSGGIFEKFFLGE